MSQIEVTDRDGWRRLFPLTKSLVFVGNHAQNDIVLDSGRGGGIQPRHLQLVATPGGYRLVNLGDSELMMANGERVPAHSVVELMNGGQIQLGDFRLRFHLDDIPEDVALAAPPPSEAAGPGSPVLSLGPGRMQEGFSSVIGLSIRIPQIEVGPDQPIEGTLTVRNLGDKTGAQFRLELEGLPPEAYEIGSGPILFPNAQKEVRLQIKHPRQPTPPVGPHRIKVRATAPVAYPGESAVATQTIEILPYHAHKIRIVTQTK